MDLEIEIPATKRQKVEQKPISCKHFVTRKKRYCKMTVAKGQEYCGEHLKIVDQPENESEEANKTNRIKCPLDPKHTVFAWKLEKHLKVCNSKIPDNLPTYISPGINIGCDESGETIDNFRLSELDDHVLQSVITKINDLYGKYLETSIYNLLLEHPVLKDELKAAENGTDSKKHLTQTSSILGYLNHFELITNDKSLVEFGGGKGQLSYWLAQIILKDEHLTNSNVIIIDRASLRHKKDNKIIERDVVERIRADIADVVLEKMDVCKEEIVGVSKHLCGAATDLALRCLLNTSKTKGFVIALCCHHRCEWKSFVGKDFLRLHGISKKEFIIMIKIVSWAVCGTGLSREARKILEEGKGNLNRIVLLIFIII